MSSQRIKAKNTVYNGYRFRSRLEARWAVFFDALGVRYEYEPEGFELPNGKSYLPDFRVKCWGTRGDYSGPPFDLYIEVKGHMTQADANKIRKFAGEKPLTYTRPDGTVYVSEDMTVPENPVLIVGSIPNEGHATDNLDCGAYDYMDGVNIFQFNYETIDGDNFAAYPAAHRGRFYLMGDDSNYINNDDIPAIEAAYRLARQARFEHGERPRGKVPQVRPFDKAVLFEQVTEFKED